MSAEPTGKMQNMFIELQDAVAHAFHCLQCFSANQTTKVLAKSAIDGLNGPVTLFLGRLKIDAAALTKLDFQQTTIKAKRGYENFKHNVDLTYVFPSEYHELHAFITQQDKVQASKPVANVPSPSATVSPQESTTAVATATNNSPSNKSSAPAKKHRRTKQPISPETINSELDDNDPVEIVNLAAGDTPLCQVSPQPAAPMQVDDEGSGPTVTVTPSSNTQFASAVATAIDLITLSTTAHSTKDLVQEANALFSTMNGFYQQGIELQDSFLKSCLQEVLQVGLIKSTSNVISAIQDLESATRRYKVAIEEHSHISHILEIASTTH
ncbi:hypothetical protein NP233_g11990 [Leucocoprinus birnbaumii]|uniref:Uncharacterized protein n=1 Tax=Leucocoprinus birnbaumii TaxID=56174 RepID=A0AAD5VJ38_9AGAR|nr:hypothetical protein NP233_g11990 [Leucocoprinus birnbaumii]